MADFVLDTSAVLALRGDEPGADRVEQILRRASHGRSEVLVSFMTRMEVLYRITADEAAESAHTAIRLLESTGIRWVSCDDVILVEAARLKARGGLSVADAWIASTALRNDAVLVHKDPEFDRVPEVRQERLPD